MFLPDTINGESGHELVLCSAGDLLLADALIRAQFVRFELSIFLSCKEFHLAHEMLFSVALWQPLTILRTYFTG
ncbi:MAG TPA: hypothetical protein VFV92_10495, partial [Candidatus Bathyarchaeia archaeon]|nr:hypothetical protein [Candidatus Bathyarchaeia archaeon]